MSSAGLAVFVFISFLAPVPLIHWLDKPRPDDFEGSG